MKKILAIVVTFAMILSMGAMFVNAELPEGISFTPGGYSSDAADFTTVGDINLTWDPDASTKLDLSDGDMADWAAAGYNMVTVDTSNMVYWVNDTTNGTGVPAGWSISTYFVIDADYLYIGFYVTDPAFAYGNSGYNGDAFQVCIDFGGKMGDQIKEDPTVMTNNKNIFYSFSCHADGAPLEISLQESDQDATLSEANGDGVKGSASKTDTGWCAEFALSLDMMFEHYKWKAWDDDARVYVGSDEHIPFKIGCCLYYLDRSETGGTINWAAGSTNGIVDDAGVPQVSWTAYDNGINLLLEYQEDLHFTSKGIVVVPLTETTPEEITAEETEPETEPETDAPATDAPTDEVTEAPTDAPADGETTAEATEAEEEGGCGAVVGFGAVAVLAAAAAAVVLKKKD